MLGKNTPSAERLQGIIEEIELVDDQKKTLGKRRTSIMAAAKAEGFSAPGIKHVLKARAKSQSDRVDDDAIRDLYLHTMGMDDEPPLFKAMRAVSGHKAGRDEIVNALLDMVPPGGEIIVRIGDPVRLWRTDDGIPHSAPWDAPAPTAGARPDVDPDIDVPLPFEPPAAPASQIPDCTPDEAEDLGAQAARDGVSVMDNPFPHDDERRPRWDAGWRGESGSDGMGPKG